MSQQRWNRAFAPAVYGGIVNPAADVSRSLSVQGDLSPFDMVMHEVAHYLRQSEIHRSIFGNRVHASQIADPARFTKFPLLTVCLASADNSQKPTSVSESEVTVYVGHWWDQMIAEAVEDGEATIATMHWHTKRVLTADKARTLVIYVGGSQRSISTKSVAIGAERYGRFELTKGRLAYLSEVPFTYNIRADRETGALLTLQ